MGHGFFTHFALFLALQPISPVWAVTRHGGTNVPLHGGIANIGELGEWKRGRRIAGRQEIRFEEGRVPLCINCPSGMLLAYHGDYVTCCRPGERLVCSDSPGTLDSVWDCCGKGHHLAGSNQIGYRCCPDGQTWDGKVCKHPHTKPLCHNGQVLVNGKCVCSNGQVWDGRTCKIPPCTHCYEGRVLHNGRCVCPAPKHEDGHGNCVSSGCTSGIRTGKCYTIQSEDGYYYGMTVNPQRVPTGYSTGKESADHAFGVFKFCLDQQCHPADVNPGKGFYIKDLKAYPRIGGYVGEWLDNTEGGGHLQRTPDFNKAGKFTITKWPCGKYCLGGFNKGIGPTCPNDYTSLTFTQDKQSCIIVKITEVPCNLNDPANNCIWKNGDQCCNPVDCSGKHGHVAPTHGATHGPTHGPHLILQGQAHFTQPTATVPHTEHDTEQGEPGEHGGFGNFVDHLEHEFNDYVEHAGHEFDHQSEHVEQEADHGFEHAEHEFDQHQHAEDSFNNPVDHVAEDAYNEFFGHEGDHEQEVL